MANFKLNFMNVKKLSDLIEGRKITKKSVIEGAGISKPTLDKILQGKNFKVSNLEKLARTLKVPVGYFFDDYETPGVVKVEATAQYSAAANQGDASVVIGDDVMVEKIRALEAIVAEKEERIKELKECMEILKNR